MKIKKPYLLFLGDAKDLLELKVGAGLAQWCPEDVVGQIRLSNHSVSLGLKELDLSEAVAKGAKSLVVGVANRGGEISEKWIPLLEQAVEIGLDIVSGLHESIGSIENLSAKAKDNNVKIYDVRQHPQSFPIGEGTKRTGKRLLMVGTDCSCGKMYTALAITREMQSRGISCSFRATGQTGILIAGEGIAVDAVVADFMAGAVESLSPKASKNHWDIIEGQGSLHHPSYSGISLALIHGSQPDAIIVCHEPTRRNIRGLPHFILPEIQTTIDMCLLHAKLTNPNVKLVGISLDTHNLNASEANELICLFTGYFNCHVFDPLRSGVDLLVDEIALM